MTHPKGSRPWVILKPNNDGIIFEFVHNLQLYLVAGGLVAVSVIFAMCQLWHMIS